MKQLIGVIIFFALFINFAYGQVKGVQLDTSFVKGYIIREVSKRDVLAYQKSALKQKSSKSFDLPIDLHGRYIFIPVDRNDIKLSQKIDSLNNIKLLEFYTFCPLQKPYTFLKSICDTELYKSFKCMTPELKSDKYFRIRGHKYKLYSFFFIEGEWCRVKYNTKLDYLTSTFKVELIDTKTDYIDLFYLINTISFNDSPEIIDKRIKRWK